MVSAIALPHATGIPDFLYVQIKSIICRYLNSNVNFLNSQSDGGVSISGSQVDRFYKDGQMGKYINLRNETGAGIIILNNNMQILFSFLISQN